MSPLILCGRGSVGKPRVPTQETSNGSEAEREAARTALVSPLFACTDGSIVHVLLEKLRSLLLVRDVFEGGGDLASVVAFTLAWLSLAWESFSDTLP